MGYCECYIVFIYLASTLYQHNNLILLSKTECELPSLNNLTEIVNVSAINGTIAGSKMVIGCRKNYGWTMDSICSEEGLWEPNPEEYIDECITQGNLSSFGISIIWYNNI